jgi:hypothetical protein
VTETASQDGSHKEIGAEQLVFQRMDSEMTNKFWQALRKLLASALSGFLYVL